MTAVNKILLLDALKELEFAMFIFKNNDRFFKGMYDVVEGEQLCLFDLTMEDFYGVEGTLNEIINSDYYKDIIVKKKTEYYKYKYQKDINDGLEYSTHIKNTILETISKIEYNIHLFETYKKGDYKIDSILEVIEDYMIIKDLKKDVSKKPKLKWNDEFYLTNLKNAIKNLEYKDVYEPKIYFKIDKTDETGI